MFRPSVTVAGTGPGVGGWVSGILNTPHPWEPPDLCKVGGSPILGVVEAGHLPCRVVRFPPPVGPGPVSPVHPVCHVPSVAQRWRRSSPAVIWLLGLVVPTVRPPALSSNPWVLAVRSPTFVPTGWRLCSRSCGPTGRRRRGTLGGWRCRRSLLGVGPASPWPAICWRGWVRTAPPRRPVMCTSRRVRPGCRIGLRRLSSGGIRVGGLCTSCTIRR